MNYKELRVEFNILFFTSQNHTPRAQYMRYIGAIIIGAMVTYPMA